MCKELWSITLYNCLCKRLNFGGKGSTGSEWNLTKPYVNRDL